MTTEVFCYVYDLSHGMARTMAQSVIGVHIEGIWHTGIVAFGKEYFFGGGIQSLPVGRFSTEYNIHPTEKVLLGKTSKSQTDLHTWLESVQSQYTMESYDIFHNNCNNFSNAVANFLLGSGIPRHIVDLPSQVLNTPLGQMLAPMYQNMQQQMQQHMVPFASPSPGQAVDTPSGVASEQQDQAGPGVTLSLKLSTQEELVKVKVASLDSSVDSLMNAIEKVTGLKKDDQRLIFKGQFLKEPSKKLVEYGVSEEVVVHLVPKPNAVKSSSASTASTDPFDVALEKVKSANRKDSVSALKTLEKIVQNVINYPLEQKYRRIKKQNPALLKRLGHVPGAFDLLVALGFQESEEGGEVLMTLDASESAWNRMLVGNNKIRDAISALEASAPPPVAQQPVNPFAGPGMNPFGGFGSGPPMSPEMMQSMMSNPMVRERVTQMLSNPEMLQQMMNNPMMQQLLQANPAMGAQMQAVMQNPQMVQQMLNSPMMQQFLSNPQMMQSMMGGQPSPPSTTGQDDSQMTEEEMIQEAIRRSLEEK